jgi:hypothetical protein
MLLRILSMLLAAVFPLSALAQMVVPAAPAAATAPLFDRLLSIEVNSGAAGSSQVVPLWASPDGRLLAIVALSHANSAPALPPSPVFGGFSDLRIVDATRLFTAGLRLQLSDSLHADLSVGSQWTPGISYLDGTADGCQGCLAGREFAAAPGLSITSLGLGLSAPFGSGPDLSFGLSWLEGGESALPQIANGSFDNPPIDLALLNLPELSTYRIDNGRTLSARGTWQFEQGSAFDLTAALTRADLMPVWYGLGGPGLNLSVDQASLGLGMASGTLRGSIVGHISSIEDPSIAGNKRWSGLDLGVSWRTPWRGEVTVGAQNLWSAPLDSATNGENSATQARVPYVQYRQDL